ncbi:hypothetical protein Y032_0125g1267 [Ancylostoma ceylanicum]|uniref:Histone-lysine N-methyltransferase SETMAR n=1 Tax=Ancylostoma ceylanicum TaxID=53326 RepID=A0A016T8V5_9BILA|nr:hypothetical protein Y032_0125g1267 [Ancylostoma ceylanicum]
MLLEKDGRDVLLSTCFTITLDPSHATKETRDKLEELGWDTVPHPPYSPDIASSDYHLLLPLEAFLANEGRIPDVRGILKWGMPLSV